MFPSWRPEAFLFDCDGLLVDTEPCWTIAESAVFARRGKTFLPEHKAAVIGKGAPESKRLFADFLDEPHNADAIFQELRESVHSIIAEQADAMPGARAVVEHVTQHVAVAVVTNAPRQLADVALDRAKLAHYFNTRITSDDVANPKPAPDPYLLACEKLGAEPTRTVVFEDSAPGVTAGQAAGMFVIGVPTFPEGFSADAVLPRLDDPRLMDWLRSHFR